MWGLQPYVKHLSRYTSAQGMEPGWIIFATFNEYCRKLQMLFCYYTSLKYFLHVGSKASCGPTMKF